MIRVDVRNAIVNNWPIKVTALALATVLWAAFAAEEPTTQLVPVRLDLQIPPTRPLRQAPPTIQALFNGSARELGKLLGSPPFITRAIPDTLTASFYTVDVGPQDITLASDANVILQDIFPRRIVVVLDEVAQRAVRVVPRVEVHTDTGFRVMGTPVAIPDSVLITGPETQVRRIGSVFTEPLELRNVRESLRRTVALDTSALGVRISQNEVEIEVRIEPITEFVLSGIPVVFGNRRWVSVPSTVDVTVRGPASRLGALTPDSVSVTVTVSGADAAGQRFAVTVRGPQGLTATARPDSIEVQRRIP